MSLLGKKRIKRSEEDDKVIKIFYNLIIFQEYAKLAGIKEEEEPKDELNENEKENNENNKTELKIENKEIKILENVINIPVKERIKNTTIKKDSKNKKIEKIEKKEEIKENTDNNNKNDKEKKITENPFAFLVKKENEVEENLEKENNNKENDNNNKEKSIFADFINKNKNKSLFGDIVNTDNTKSLFNSQNDEKNEKNGKDKPESNKFSLFGNTLLFSNKDNNNTNAKKSLFSNNAGKSLFGDNNNNNSNNTPTLLFSGINIPKNPFQDIKGDAFVKGLFNNNNNNNKSENNDKKNNNSLFDAGDDNDENSDEDDKPKNNYIAEPLKSQDITQFSKLFNLNINNLFLYNKTEKKYISKGRGFFSIEKTKDEKSEKHQAVVVFRNHAGNKLVEGFLDNKFNKFNIFSKDFDFVVCFGIIMINEGKPDFSFIKIPFKNEQNANELKDAYEKAMEFIDKKD